MLSSGGIDGSGPQELLWVKIPTRLVAIIRLCPCLLPGPVPVSPWQLFADTCLSPGLLPSSFHCSLFSSSFLLSFLTPPFIYLVGKKQGCMHTTVLVGMSENSLQWWFFSFYHLGSREETQIIRLGSKHLDQLNHLTDPILFSLSSRPSLAAS